MRGSKTQHDPKQNTKQQRAQNDKGYRPLAHPFLEWCFVSFVHPRILQERLNETTPKALYNKHFPANEVIEHGARRLLDASAPRVSPSIITPWQRSVL
jgi:hypothetical protein